MISIEELISSRNPSSSEEAKAILRELIQQIVLIGLSRGEFFNEASFYGGTALRIFYGLNRYSEDLDFTLNSISPNFSLEPYIGKIEEVAKSYGLDLEIKTKSKSIKTPIESAFAKVNTYQTFLNLKIKNNISQIHKDEVLKVKFEIDCEPSLGFNTQIKWLDIPEYATVQVLDEPSLFAGKIHAILCRNYKNNVKGRDYYDLLFYIRNRIKPNLEYLRNKLIDSNKIKKDDEFNIDIVKKMLKERIENLNIDQVIEDAQHFVFNNEDISFYNKDLFIQMIDKI